MTTGVQKVALAAVLALVGAGLGSIIGRACGVGTEFALNSAAGPPGTDVTATGVGFAAGPVSIRWDSPSGQTLATTSGPYFNGVAFSIPASATPGLHYLDAWDGVGAQYWPTTFTVTAAAATGSTGAATGATTPPTSQTTSPSSNVAGPGGSTSSTPSLTAAGAPAPRGSNSSIVSPVDPATGQSLMDAVPAAAPADPGSSGSTASRSDGGESAQSLFENPSSAFNRGARGSLALSGAAPQQSGVSPGLLTLAVCLPLLLSGAVFLGRRRRVRAH